MSRGGVRQRYSQDYPSSDGESDDAISSDPSPSEKSTAWTIVQDIIWVSSTVFIIYVGDWRSNLFHVLLFDDRIKRIPFNLGVLFIILNAGVVMHAGFSLTSAPVVALLGLLSFSLISFAMWPIWSFLSIPLLMTLLMASMIVWDRIWSPLTRLICARGPSIGE